MTNRPIADALQTRARTSSTGRRSSRRRRDSVAEPVAAPARAPRRRAPRAPIARARPGRSSTSHADQERRARRPRQHGAVADLAPPPTPATARAGRTRGERRDPPDPGRAARSIDDGRRTVVGRARPELLAIPAWDERPSIAGEHARRSTTKCTPRASARRAAGARLPSTLTAAAHVRAGVDLQHAGRACVEESVDAASRPSRAGGRSAGNRPAVAGRRQVEEPGGELGEIAGTTAS